MSEIYFTDIMWPVTGVLGKNTPDARQLFFRLPHFFPLVPIVSSIQTFLEIGRHIWTLAFVNQITSPLTKMRYKKCIMIYDIGFYRLQMAGNVHLKDWISNLTSQHPPKTEDWWRKARRKAWGEKRIQWGQRGDRRKTAAFWFFGF